MGKFNKKDEGVKPTIVNHMGEKAYKPNAEEELVSTVMTTMLSDSYYEKEKDKVNRIKDLMDRSVFRSTNSIVCQERRKA